MKLYLLNILPNNTLADVKAMAQMIKESGAGILQSSVMDAQKYMVQFVFEDSKKRDEVADKIQHIAFEFSSIDYDDELYEKYKSGKAKVNYTEKPKNHKPKKYELKIDSYLEKNNIDYKKIYTDYISYYITLSNKKSAMYNLDYNEKWLQFCVEEGQMILCHQKSFMDKALNETFKQIDKEERGIVQ